MPKPEKKKLSKKERKRLQQEQGRQGARAREVGVRSRSDITVPTNWEVETHSYNHQDALQFISPGKMLYHRTAKVNEMLVKRKMNFCLNESSEFSGNKMDARDPEFEPQPGLSRKIAKQDASAVKAFEMKWQFVVCKSTQITSFIKDINITSTPTCNGVYNTLLCIGSILKIMVHR